MHDLREAKDRIEPTPRGSCRFWLFGTIRLVRNWDRIGTNGLELAEVFASEI
jgi:predicted DNA-binding WGR domain protein